MVARMTVTVTETVLDVAGLSPTVQVTGQRRTRVQISAPLPGKSPQPLSTLRLNDTHLHVHRIVRAVVLLLPPQD